MRSTGRRDKFLGLGLPSLRNAIGRDSPITRVNGEITAWHEGRQQIGQLDGATVDVDPAARIRARLDELTLVLESKNIDISPAALATSVLEAYLAEIEAEYAEELGLVRSLFEFSDLAH